VSWIQFIGLLVIVAIEVVMINQAYDVYYTRRAQNEMGEYETPVTRVYVSPTGVEWVDRTGSAPPPPDFDPETWRLYTDASS
jgi:hypothetical protein